MLRRVRETAPGLLVPAIWLVVAGAHARLVSEHTLLVAHAVMSVLLVAFLVLSWQDMETGVLRAWRQVIVVGIPLGLAGTVGLAADPNLPNLLAVAVVGWQLAPAPAFLRTGRAVAHHPRIHLAAAAASVIGAGIYLAAPLAGPTTGVRVLGLAVVGLGQTAGILAAVVDY